MVRGEADLETTARHLLRHQCGGYVFARIQWRLTVRMEEQEHVPGCSLRAAVDLISLAGGGRLHPRKALRPPPLPPARRAGPVRHTPSLTTFPPLSRRQGPRQLLPPGPPRDSPVP